MQNILDQIKILFFGVTWDQADIYRFNRNAIKHYSVTNPEIAHTQGRTPSPNKILGFEIGRKSSFKKKLVELLERFQMETMEALFFVVKTKKDAARILKIIEAFSFGEVELYGMDPDYFLSLVPLTGDHHRTIEKYILRLKADFSVAGRAKQLIKSILIYIRFSDKLYEGFVITARPSHTRVQ